MKKMILVLCAVLALGCCTAFAEAVNKVVLWENTATEVDEAGNLLEQPVKVTLETAEPVEIEMIDEVDVSDGFFAKIRRDGVAPVVVSITPADYGAHANLNKATEEQLQAFIAKVAEQFEEGKYVSEIKKTESGNTFLAVGDAVTRSVWTIYEDTLIEIIQYKEDFTELTAEDQAFAIEILQGIWME